mmetsp:Transcript_6904/g.10370  ORF Transcript_6904/g.10370 Transcript_6904/m.10370 type:complete len:354 (+) Transcript_6904:139-1200(+)
MCVVGATIALRNLAQSSEGTDTCIPVPAKSTTQPSLNIKKENGVAEAMKTQEKHCVQHNYHDHSLDNDRTFKVDKQTVSKGGVTVPFPMKLHDMLEHIELLEPELAHVVTWQPHGRCFIVHKPKLFAERVLARFFQQKKYASFQRQLNLYGFNRITKGPDRGSYYHELFLRGKKFLSRGINRMKIKGTGARMASNPDAEPDFYHMPPLAATTDATPTSTMEEEENNLKVSAGSNAVQYMPANEATESAAHQPKTQEELEFVFGNMPFHSINQFKESRRHSLMAIRRNSLLSRRNSLVTPNTSDNDFSSGQIIQAAQPQPDDDVFFNEMDMISTLGNSDISDRQMVHILNKIIK